MALTDKQKDCVVFYLGWPAKTLVVDSTDYSKIFSDRLTDLSTDSEKRIKGILDKLEDIDKQLDEARCRVSTLKVQDIQLNPEEIDQLKKERRRCIKELSCFLDLKVVCKSSSMGNICI